jgi:4-hydroxy-4-methyl-2-oxoglutarate aldolase
LIDVVQESPNHPSVAAVTDALGRVLHHQANVLDLISPTRGRVLFGVAVTIRFLPYREDLFQEAANSFARCFYAAIGKEPHGKVVVLDSSGYVDTSVGGGTKLSRLHNTGVAGLITDARLRDFRELAEYDPVYYCAGEAVRAGTADLMPSAVNVPVVLGGVTVVPGDHVYADSTGAVIIPASDFDEVWAAAREIETNEIAQRQSIRGEHSDDINAGSGEL